MPRSGLLRRVIFPLVLLPLLAVGLTAPAAVAGKNPDGVVSSHHNIVKVVSRVERAMRIASAQVGDPYVYGAAGPGAFDCSGLVYYATHHAGFNNVPRTSAAQGGFMRHISRGALHRGDFIFFTDGGGVYHVGFFTGWSNGQRIVLHAPRPGLRVKREAVWTNSWFAATLRGR